MKRKIHRVIRLSNAEILMAICLLFKERSMPVPLASDNVDVSYTTDGGNGPAEIVMEWEAHDEADLSKTVK